MRGVEASLKRGDRGRDGESREAREEGTRAAKNTVDTGQCHLEIWCQNDETDRNKKRINEDIFSSCSHDQRHVVGRMKQARDKSRAMLRSKLWQSSKNYAWDSE